MNWEALSAIAASFVEWVDEVIQQGASDTAGALKGLEGRAGASE